MIKIFFRKKEDFYEVEATGHSLFDKKNKDVVCAAVSVLLQSWYFSTKELCSEKISHKQGNGFFYSGFSSVKDCVLILLNSLMFSLLMLEKQYPNNICVSMEGYNGWKQYSEKWKR